MTMMKWPSAYITQGTLAELVEPLTIYTQPQAMPIARTVRQVAIKLGELHRLDWGMAQFWYCANKQWGSRLYYQPQQVNDCKVLINPRLRGTLGRAIKQRHKQADGSYHMSAHSMELHEAIFDKHEPLAQAELLETFFHEVAHLCEFAVPEIANHGSWWQIAMSCFGYKPLVKYNGQADFRNYSVRKYGRRNGNG